MSSLLKTPQKKFTCWYSSYLFLYSFFISVACLVFLFPVSMAAAIGGQAVESQTRGKSAPNIILVVLDTVRSDYTGLETDGLTPNLKKLAAESTVFPNAWANAPWTVPSHASMFTGLLPSQHGCTTENVYLDGKFPTLASLLNESGYETAAFYSNPWLNNDTTGLLRGFKLFKEAWIGGLGRLSLGRGDQGGFLSNTYVNDFLEQRPKDKPFFLFINYLEAHLPYDPMPKYRADHMEAGQRDDIIAISWAHEFNAGLHASDKVDWRKVRALYGGDVHSADILLGSLLESLKKAGLYDDTVIIVTSDHGENLGEHGLLDHQFSVHETLLSVPLVIRAPGFIPAGGDLRPVMLSDVFDTILDMAGGKKRNTPFSRSLLEKKDGRKRYVVSEYAGAPKKLVSYLKQLNPALDIRPLSRWFRTVTDGTWRFTTASDKRKTLHNLVDDPGQERECRNDNREIAGKMENYLSGIFSAIKRKGGKKRKMDEKTRKKLKSLGYIQ
ncbi:MAG: sulfatase [bacterium]|nr:sulfatase [bacterium]